MVSSPLALLVALSALAATTAVPGRHALEEVIKPPRGWADVGSAGAAGTAQVELSFFLKVDENKARRLKGELLRRSDPASPLYGKWLTRDQVQGIVAPSPAAIATVENFIKSHGATPVAVTSDVIIAQVQIQVAEEMLGADYRLFVHAASGMKLVRCLSYSLPAEVKEVVSLVGPTTHFPRVSSLMPMRDAAESNTPDNLRSLYSVDDVMGGKASNNKQAVTAFLRQYYSQDDLDQFFSEEFPAGADTPISTVGDAVEGRSAGVESMLDIEYMPALGSLIPTGFWGFSGRSPNAVVDEPFLKWLYTVGNTTDDEVPLLFSTSYGEDETSEVPSDYADRINTEFVKCGLRGISLLFASGDSGAAADSGDCPNDEFMPMWPAASPYVTAVGGTSGATMPETAWSGSSGGFSNWFGIPSWQEDAVSTYLSTAGDTLPASSYFNSSGRGFPDISAQAVEYPVVVNGATRSVAGTSCASPCAGGVFGLLNDARLAAGKSQLGFLNPMLYANPSALNDCTQGTQGGCSASVSGFTAIEGWDPVTGLGSPNYTALLDVAMALP